MTAETLPAVCASPRMAKNLTYFKPALSEIKFGKMRFLITDRPTEFALDNFVKELQRHRVKKLVRVCEPTYEKEHLQVNGIEVIDWEFVDGQPPPETIIDKWLNLVIEYFDSPPASTDPTTVPNIDNIPQQVPPLNDKSIAVHCVAGLGRAPVLIAIALLEAGMGWEDVIFLIRTNRRGALNEKQLEFLKNYKPSGKLRKLRYEENKERKSCAIM